MKSASSLIVAALLLAGSPPLHAQIAVSANDGKQLRPNEGKETRTPDTVSIIDLRGATPKTLATIPVPASMIGPPAAVAVARNGRFALVTAAQRLNAAADIELNDQVSVIDLARPASPRVVQTLQAGPGASGVAINRAGTLALVASTGDDTISIYSIAGNRLTPEGKLQLEAKTRPTDVAFAPDGRTAMVVGQQANKLILLSIVGKQVGLAGATIDAGQQPYGVVYSPDGRYTYNTNLGGRPLAPGAAPPARDGAPRIGTVAAVDLTTGAVNNVDVGQTPEHVALSADGKYLAVVVANGSAAQATAPGYHPYGLLQIYSVRGTSLTRVAEAHSGAWCQGAVFSANNRTVLLQCAMTRAIEVYRFDGKTALTQDVAATLKFDARPGAIAVATSR
jgi:DNA-binding beta-propeller fold protein YncE